MIGSIINIFSPYIMSLYNNIFRFDHLGTFGFPTNKEINEYLF